jgi:hypothetical protein
MKVTEHAEQTAYFQWLSIQSKIPGYEELELAFATPNAAKRSYKLAAHMKAEGMKKGVPDVFLPIPRNSYHGLWLEFKVMGRKPNKDQLWWKERLLKQGYAWACPQGFEPAKEITMQYMALTKRPETGH